jgi:hypothetical protein
MFRALSKRAIEAFFRRGAPPARGASAMPEAIPRPSVPAVASASVAFELTGKRAVRVPPQAHRAPYLEDIDDWS